MNSVVILAWSVMSSGNWMIGQVVWRKIQSTDAGSQNAFHSAQPFHGGLGTVFGSRFPGTPIAPPIQTIRPIFFFRAGRRLSTFDSGVNGHVTSRVTPGSQAVRHAS